MKSKGSERPEPAARTGAAALYAGAGLALLIYLWVYAPVMNTQFLFDDTKQMFALSKGNSSLGYWLGPVRPVLMATYWFNNQMGQEGTFGFHVVNLLIHALTSGLVFLIVKRLLHWAGCEGPRQQLLAGFAAGVFLLHPAQAESVAYIAGRSESLSGMFSCAALVAFLYRKETAIGWGNVAVVGLLSMLALFSKEQAVVLFGLFALTDFWWNPGFGLAGLRGNWKLYGPLVVGAAYGVYRFRYMILGEGTGGSAGFSIMPWQQYLFTQFRAIWVYVGNFVFPANLNVDWEFAFSRTLAEHGAVVGLAALLGVSAAAWVLRKRYGLACFGFFVFLLLLAPTSSVLPIKDPIADRRMYLPMIGLLLIAVDVLRHVTLDKKTLSVTCAAVLALSAATARARAQVWSDPVSLWEDSAAKSPGKARPQFQLGFAYFEQQQYDKAVVAFEKAATLEKPGYDLLLDLGLAYDGLHQPEKALEKLRAAAAIEPTAHVYSQIAKVYASNSRWAEAMRALDEAEKLDANYIDTIVYKGLIHLATGDAAGSVPYFQRALQLNPMYPPAREGLLQAQKTLRGGR